MSWRKCRKPFIIIGETIRRAKAKYKHSTVVLVLPGPDSNNARRPHIMWTSEKVIAMCKNCLYRLHSFLDIHQYTVATVPTYRIVATMQQYTPTSFTYYIFEFKVL